MGMNWLFGKGDAPRAPVIIAVLVLMNALLVRAIDPPGLVRLRDFAFDTFQRFKPREVTEDLGVTIVDIDEAALTEFGQWPWPRYRLAELVNKLQAAGAAVVRAGATTTGVGAVSGPGSTVVVAFAGVAVAGSVELWSPGARSMADQVRPEHLVQRCDFLRQRLAACLGRRPVRIAVQRRQHRRHPVPNL